MSDELRHMAHDLRTSLGGAFALSQQLLDDLTSRQFSSQKFLSSGIKAGIRSGINKLAVHLFPDSIGYLYVTHRKGLTLLNAQLEVVCALLEKCLIYKITNYRSPVFSARYGLRSSSQFGVSKVGAEFRRELREELTDEYGEEYGEESGEESCNVPLVVAEVFTLFSPVMQRQVETTGENLDCHVPHWILLRILINVISNSIKNSPGALVKTELKWETIDGNCLFQYRDTRSQISSSTKAVELVAESNHSRGFGLETLRNLIAQGGGEFLSASHTDQFYEVVFSLPMSL